MSHERKAAVRAGLTMFIFSGVWILGSDWFVAAAVPAQYHLVAQDVKGLLYVALATLLVYSLSYQCQVQSKSIKAQHDRLAEAQQMRTSALVTFGAWHDIRNIATAFTMNAQYLSSSRLTPAIHEEIAQEFSQLSSRLVSLTDSVHVGRLDDARYFSPAKVVADYVQLLNRSRLLKHDARVHVGDEIPDIYGSISSFEQMLANMVLNGDQATENGQPVQVVLRSTVEGINLQVIDFGSGIPAEDLERIWDPLFTTKTSGTGLGLFVVKEAVVKLGGAIAVSSSPGKGTCFSVRLPVEPRATA